MIVAISSWWTETRALVLLESPEKQERRFISFVLHNTLYRICLEIILVKL